MSSPTDNGSGEDRLSDANDPVARAADKRLNTHGDSDLRQWQKELGQQEENNGFGYRSEKDTDNGEANAKSFSPDQLESGESNAAPGPSEAGDNLYNPSKDKSGGFRLRFTRRQGVAGGIVGLLVGGGLFGSLIFTGPLQLVHLSQILSHNFTKMESDSDNRNGHLLRDARAWREKDIRYTRVGGIASRLMNRALDQMEAKGFKVTGSDVNGRPTAVELDTEKIKANFPETKNMSSADLDKWAGEKFGTDSFRNGKLDISGFKAQTIAKILSNSSIRLLGDNKAVAAVKVRPLKKFFGLGSMLHPFSRALDNALSKAADNAGKKGKNKQSATEEALQNAEEAQTKPVEEPGLKAQDEAHAAHGGLQDKIIKGVGSAEGLAWVTGCTLKDSGKAITAINRAIVARGEVQAAGDWAGGSQVQYSNGDGGGDLTNQQVAAKAAEIAGIFTTPAGQAMTGEQGGSFNKTDQEQWERVKGAYADPQFAQNLEGVGNKILDWSGLNTAASVFHYLSLTLLPKDPCSIAYAAGIVALGAIQNGIALASCATGCEGEALIQGVRQLATYIVHTAETAVLSSAAIGVVEKEIISSGTPTALAKDFFTTQVGKQTVFFGARALAGEAGRAAGGIALAGTVTSTLIGSAGQEEQQQFASESFASRIFNTSDYRSLTGQLSMMIKPNIQSNLASALGSIEDMSGSLGSVFGKLLPGASAASDSSSWSGNFDWGTPQYGIPDKMLNDPNLSDPFQNAEAVGQYLSQSCSDGGDIGPDKGACGGSGGITDRIMKCFGNTLTYQDGLWDVAPASNVNDNTGIDPNSSDYQDAHCADIQDAKVATTGAGDTNVASSQECSSGKSQAILASYSKKSPNSITQQPRCNKVTTAGTVTGSTSMWTRTIMFVNDASTIKADDCLAGGSDTSQQSCTDEGMDAGSAAPATASNSTATRLPVAGDTGDAGQVITVQAASESSTTAQLQTWVKNSDGTWVSDGTPVSAPIAANLGDKGMTVNTKEGLDATPEGDFTLTQAFGAKADPASSTGLPYHHTGANDWWDENPTSPTYNKLVVQKASPGGASEHLATTLPYYNYAVVIDANTANAPGGMVPGNGSGFFLHVERSANDPTQGCISIPEDQLVNIMKWLKPGSNPRILIGLPSTTQTSFSTKHSPAQHASSSKFLAYGPTHLASPRTDSSTIAPISLDKDQPWSRVHDVVYG